MAFRILILISLCVALSGGSAPHIMARAKQAREAGPFAKVMRNVERLVASGDWAGALAQSEKSAPAALQAGDLRSAAWLYYMLSQARTSTFEYRHSLAAALKSRDVAVAFGAWSTAAIATYALARVHGEMGNYAEAERAGNEMLRFAARSPTLQTIEMHSLMGVILRLGGKLIESREQYLLAIAEAESRGSTPSKADALEQAGYAMIQVGDLDVAEQYLVEAFRLRCLNAPNDLGFSFKSIGQLRQRQQRYREALRYYELCLQAKTPRLIPHEIHYYSAQIYSALGDKARALTELRQATTLIRAFRLNLPFGDQSRIASEGRLQDIYSLYAKLAAEAAVQERSSVLTGESFSAAMENRAASLRAGAGVDSGWRSRLPAGYWTALNQFRTLQLRSMSSDDPATREQLERVRTHMSEMESVAAREGISGVEQLQTPAEIQKALAPDEILIAYQLGETDSWCWTMSRHGLKLFPLPSRQAIARHVDELNRRIQENSGAFGEPSQWLYRTLLGPIDNLSSFSLITIIPDDTLFQLPFSTLVTAHTTERTSYLIETHAIRLLPTAIQLPRRHEAARGFLGVGDPVCNRADSRWKSSIPSWRSLFRSQADGLEMPRLVGSATELEHCRKPWSSKNTTLLIGPQIGLDAIANSIRNKPFVAHFATHVVQPAGMAPSPVILLGIDPAGKPEVLNDTDIAAILRPAPRFVTLSGCGSGRGALAPGTGLLGLTRAWLMSGAVGVMATLWGVVDDNGGLFEEYYRSLLAQGEAADSRSAAQAIQKSQLTAIQRGGEGSHPYAWGAYFVIGVL